MPLFQKRSGIDVLGLFSFLLVSITFKEHIEPNEFPINLLNSFIRLSEIVTPFKKYLPLYPGFLGKNKLNLV